MDNSVTVITLTRERPDLVIRAAQSVRHQDYSGPIDHVIVIDDCYQTMSALSSNAEILRGCTLVWVPREGGEGGLPRIVDLRNRGVGFAQSRWVAFLDDDDEFEPTHISSLVECALVTKSPAVHSYAKYLLPDGSPYLDQRMPHSPDPELGSRIYQVLRQKGVVVPGSNIFRDVAEPPVDGAAVRTVIMGEWLLERSLLQRFPLVSPQAPDDLTFGAPPGEDDVLTLTLLQNEISVATTQSPTLLYYLGGRSTRAALPDFRLHPSSDASHPHT